MINIDDFDLCIIFLHTLTIFLFCVIQVHVVTIAYVHMVLNTMASKVALLLHYE